MGIILIIVVVGLAVWLLSKNHESGRSLFSTPTPLKIETALEVLEKRYACGEIGRHEFEARRRDLG